MNIEKALKSLKAKGYNARYFETGTEAADYIVSSVSGKTVGIGGSVTVQQLGLYDRLCENNTVYWHWKQEREAARRNAANTQVYLTSANAISENGEIVNIDGEGNRVAAMAYGHERLIIVAGVNKLAENLPAAIDRARNIASPLNAIRLGKKTPCALSSPMNCHDCSSPDRICRAVMVLLEKSMGIPEADVILVGEKLGY